MKTKLIAVFIIVGLAMAISPLFAQRPATNGTNPGGQAFSLPAHAVEVAPGIFSLGVAADPATGKKVEGFAVFHHRDGHSGGPPGSGGGGDDGGNSSSCFALLDRHTSWNMAEAWLMNPANTRNLSETDLFNTQAASLQKWEEAANGEIFGAGTQTSSILVADTESPDEKNEVYFGPIDSDGAIAVTIVWGIFSGPPPGRELVEWDQIYDDEDFDWSLSGEVGAMDFDNIATHENGHAAGLGHPSDSCTEETMFRFAEEGETKKQTLHDGDITGINELY